MSKSLAQKKSERKERGSFARVRGGHKAKRAATRAYHQCRAHLLPKSPYPKRTVMAEPLRKLAVIERIENSGYDKTPNLASYREHATLTAVLSDGRRIVERAEVRYKKGEREKIFEAIARGEGSEKEVAMMQAILNRRASALQSAYGRLQKAYGKGVPWQPPA